MNIPRRLPFHARPAALAAVLCCGHLLLLTGPGALAQPAPAASSASLPAAAAANAAATLRIRGTVQSVDARSIIVQSRDGEVLTLARAERMPVSEVYPIELDEIRAGSYVGAAALPQPDGTQRALEVLVFPEAARGTGEGHHPWDLQPESTMTNGAVASLAPAPAAVAAGGRELRLSYQGGEKTVIVPSGVPIVSLRPADDALLVPGTKVLITAQERAGKPTALRVLVGRNGFAPPM